MFSSGSRIGEPSANASRCRYMTAISAPSWEDSPLLCPNTRSGTRGEPNLGTPPEVWNQN